MSNTRGRSRKSTRSSSRTTTRRVTRRRGTGKVGVVGVLVAIIVTLIVSSYEDISLEYQDIFDEGSNYTESSDVDNTDVDNTDVENTGIESTDIENSSSEVISYTMDEIPEYSGELYVVINDNVPFFSDSELTEESFETYSELDSLGRCGVALVCVGVDIMPTEDRESISSVYPTGWEQGAYDIVDGGYLYNRSHLIGFQLTGENANELNLITGTRAMNAEGMLPFENMIADYVEETGNHVYYRVTPIFEDDNLLATGVLMEAKSVEDNGEGILFNVFCYNAQEGIEIDYATGENWLQ